MKQTYKIDFDREADKAEGWQHKGMIVYPNRFPIEVHAAYDTKWQKAASHVDLAAVRAGMFRYAKDASQAAEQEYRYAEKCSSRGLKFLLMAAGGGGAAYMSSPLSRSSTAVPPKENTNVQQIETAGMAAGLTLVVVGSYLALRQVFARKAHKNNVDRLKAQARMSYANADVIKSQYVANEKAKGLEEDIKPLVTYNLDA